MLVIIYCRLQTVAEFVLLFALKTRNLYLFWPLKSNPNIWNLIQIDIGRCVIFFSGGRNEKLGEKAKVKRWPIWVGIVRWKSINTSRSRVKPSRTVVRMTTSARAIMVVFQSAGYVTVNPIVKMEMMKMDVQSSCNASTIVSRSMTNLQLYPCRLFRLVFKLVLSDRS